MAGESEASISRIRSIHIDLEEHSVETLAHDGIVIRFTFSPEGVFQQLLQHGSLEGAARRLLSTSQPETEGESNAATDAGVESLAPTTEEAVAPREKQPAITFCFSTTTLK